MDIETILRYLSYLVNMLANAPKACESLNKGWTCFTKFLESLDGYGEGEPSPPLVRMNTTIVPLTGALSLTGSGIPSSHPPAGHRETQYRILQSWWSTA